MTCETNKEKRRVKFLIALISSKFKTLRFYISTQFQASCNNQFLKTIKTLLNAVLKLLLDIWVSYTNLMFDLARMYLEETRHQITSQSRFTMWFKAWHSFCKWRLWRHRTVTETTPVTLNWMENNNNSDSQKFH